MRCSSSPTTTRWTTSARWAQAYEAEQGPAAKDAIAQILTNSRMCAEGHRPICQDTGIVNVFVKWGQDCRLESDRRPAGGRR
jgi:tartrate dehydratase alpha subunit/fumarate hydratase class I-like protein